MSVPLNRGNDRTQDLMDVFGQSDQALSPDGICREQTEQRLSPDGALEEEENAFDSEGTCVLDCLLKNSIIRSEFDGEKFFSFG